LESRRGVISLPSPDNGKLSETPIDMPPKYIAEISPVREVTLIGAADLAYWTDYLHAENVRPANHDGQAQIYISAAASRFKGIPFREVSISICAYPDGADATQEGIFLAHAFNSARFFAWCERTFFATPYYYAAVAVDPGPPASFEVTQRMGARLRAAMAATTSANRREPIHSGQCWEPTIFLPTRLSKPNAPPKQFFARFSGDTQVFSYLPDRDRITIQPSAAAPILQSLIDSRFAGRQWMIRQSGTHARSKTVIRPQHA
jgi:hypothetical protein